MWKFSQKALSSQISSLSRSITTVYFQSYRTHAGCSTSTVKVQTNVEKDIDGTSQSTTAKLPQDGLSLKDFLKSYQPTEDDPTSIPPNISHMDSAPTPFGANAIEKTGLRSKNYYIETYGCQMNVADSELVHSILRKAGLTQVSDISDSDVILINTCAIREGAEQRIWGRLNEFKAVVRRSAKLGAKKIAQTDITTLHNDVIGKRRVPLSEAPIVGVLGCMAERLKSKLLETDKIVDLVAGPDSYRDLPRLIALVEGGDISMNTQLSLDETYADIVPVRVESNNVSAFVSITRGCDNMCSYCIVPYTRGRERSRQATSIVEEVRMLAAQGFKEITLLGQNVNSYNDTSVIKEEEERLQYLDSLDAEQTTTEERNELEVLKLKSIEGIEQAGTTRVSPSGRVALKRTFEAGAGSGFKNISRRQIHGVNFADLLQLVSDAVPGVRIRFTSPHPKDFSPDLVDIISNRPNLCKHLHMPAQSGSTSMLERMRRGYSRESYIQLVASIREKVPHMAFSTDVITGFCDETIEEHNDTVSLMRTIQYDHSFMFKYSQREKTHAHRVYQDNVPEDVKSTRLDEIIRMDQLVHALKFPREVGRIHLVLADGYSKKSNLELTGRTDTNIPVNFPIATVPFLKAADLIQFSSLSPIEFTQKLQELYALQLSNENKPDVIEDETNSTQIGEFIAVQIDDSRRNSLRGIALFRTTLEDYHAHPAEWSKLQSLCMNITDEVVTQFKEGMDVTHFIHQ